MLSDSTMSNSLRRTMLSTRADDEIFNEAVAFLYRWAERNGYLPQNPGRNCHGVEQRLGLVIFDGGAPEFRVVSYHETSRGSLRFRQVETSIRDSDEYVDLARKAVRALNDFARAIPSLARLGLSTREIGRLLGLSHEAVRKQLL